MSWFSKNYEKAALGGAVALALGIAYLGWSNYSGVQDDFGPGSSSGGQTDAAVAGADAVPKAQQSLKLGHAWTQGVDGERPVDLFTGIALFIHKGNPEQPIDLLKDAAVHPPIPNVWWLEHRIDPGFGDSPNRDPDDDGFTNREEYDAKTDPNDKRSFPGLIDKLMFVKDDSRKWWVRPGYSDGDKFAYTYEDSNRVKLKIAAGEELAPEAMFFPTEPVKNRFKHLGKVTRKEMNPRTNAEEETTYARFEDQAPNKKGKVYEVPEGLPEARKNDFAQFDRSAVFSLEALGRSGAEFKVAENTSFALPPDAPKKDFLLKKVTPESVTVEYLGPDGKTITLEINKGSTRQSK